MKKNLLFIGLVILSKGVWGTSDNSIDLIKLYRTDSPRFQLEMRNTSESQITQVYISQTQDEELSRDLSAINEDNQFYLTEKLKTFKMSLRKRRKQTYVQSDSWPQEKDDSQDPDYVCSFLETNALGIQLKEKETSVDISKDEEVNSLKDIFENSISFDEPDRSLLNLRKQRRVTYVQSDSWPQEKDDSQDPDYIGYFLDKGKVISPIKRKEIDNSQNENFNLSSENIFKDVLSGYEIDLLQQENNDPTENFVEGSRTKTRRLSLKLNKSRKHKTLYNFTERQLSSAKPLSEFSESQRLLVQQIENSFKKNSNNTKGISEEYQGKELDLINTEKVLQKYNRFPYLEKLKLTMTDLLDMDLLGCSNLKELCIDVRKVSSKLQEREKRKEQGELIDLYKAKFFNRDRMEVLQDFLEKNSNLETFYFGYHKPSKLPSAIWNLKNLKNLTLKMLRITEVPLNIKNLENLKTLDLSNNKINKLPWTMCNLKKLEVLTLIGNDFLEVFPAVINKLPNLKVLRIDEIQKKQWNESLQKLISTNKNLNIEVW